MQETNAAAINLRWFYFAALILRNSTMNNNNFLRKDKGDLLSKAILIKITLLSQVVQKIISYKYIPM